MSAIEIAVILGSFSAIVWVNWYFLAPRAHASVAAASDGGVQEVVIRVAGGYDPGSVRVRSGARVRLIFDRQENSGCSEEVVIPEFGIRRFLPPGERTAVEFTPAKPGSYEFTCGMSMLRGTVLVEEAN